VRPKGYRAGGGRGGGTNNFGSRPAIWVSAFQSPPRHHPRTDHITASRAFMLAAVWVPYNLGKTALPALLSLKTLLAGSEPLQDPHPPVADGTFGEVLLRGAIALIARLKTALRGAGGAADGGRVSDPLELLSPLNRMAVRLEVSLTGLAPRDWVCLCLGYCESLPCLGTPPPQHTSAHCNGMLAREKWW